MTLPVQDVSQLGIFRTKPLNDSGLFVWPWIQFFQNLERFRENAPQYFFTSHATRLQLNPGNVSTGTFFFESDRSVVYVSNGANWQYVAGIFSGALVALPSDLGTNDTGFLFGVQDYNHLLEWNGSSWQFAPGDTGGGFTVPFVIAPNPTIGWHVADGSSVNILQPNGGITPQTAPNTPGSWIRL